MAMNIRLVITLSISVAVADLYGQWMPEMSQTGLADYLQYQEKLIRTSTAQFEKTTTSTPPENVSRIREFCRTMASKDGLIQSENDYTRYIISGDFAKNNSFSAKWWRKGVKEKIATYLNEEEAQVDKVIHGQSILAYDGQLVRKLDSDGKQQSGYIGTFETSHWGNDNFPEHLLSLTSEFSKRPYSEIVRYATNLEIKTLSRNNAAYSRVTFGHPNEKGFAFALIFDPNGRVVEREVLIKFNGMKSWEVREKHEFADYHEYKDSSGETIWFPGKSVWHYYMGNTPEGNPIEYKSEIIIIKNIQFNVDIPDGQFVISFPDGIRIYDDAAGLGWIESKQAVSGQLVELAHKFSAIVPHNENTGKQSAASSPSDSESITPASATPIKPSNVRSGQSSISIYVIFVTIVVILFMGGTIVQKMRVRR